MTLKDLKIQPENYAGKDIASLPDRPELSAAEMKARFDALAKEVIVPKFNAAVDILTGSEGAAQIGIREGMSVQDALDAAARKANVLEKTNTVPFAPTADYHPATKKYVDDAAFKSGAVASVFGRAGNVVAQPGDYTAEMVGAYAKGEVLDEEVLEACGLPATAKPVDVLRRLVGGEMWRRLVRAHNVRVNSGEVFSLDLTGIDTDKYWKFQLLAFGQALISSGNERIRFRVNNDSSATYAGSNYMDIHGSNTDRTPYWTKATNYNTMLAEFLPHITSQTMPFAINAQLTPLGRHLQAVFQFSHGDMSGFSIGAYKMAEGAAFSSLQMILQNFTGSRFVEFSEVVLLGWEKGAL